MTAGNRGWGRARAWLPWLLFALVAGLHLYAALPELATTARTVPLGDWMNRLMSSLFPLMFAFTGVLIISRQPRNLIGWLLAAPSFGDVLSVVALAYLQRAGPQPTWPTLLLAWYLNWNWWTLIGPTLLIFLLFPTGRLLSPRWRWAVAVLALSFLYFVLGAALQTRLSIDGTDLTWTNPWGVLPELGEEAFRQFLLPFVAGLAGSALLSVAALAVRYRRAGPVERAQINWLLYPGAVVCATFGLVVVSGQEPGPWQGAVFSLALLGIPAAIAIAILRYRLFDIDVIIRRTLVYSLLTAVLASAYFGTVLVLENVLRALTGQGQNSLVVVVSTLAIAALFVPVRSRVQAAIDRRFYRRKYDAARTLAGFAAGARDETNLEQLSTRLVAVVDETMQPERVSLWLRPTTPTLSGKERL